MAKEVQGLQQQGPAPQGCKVGTGQARGRALNPGHCLAGRVAVDTKRRNNSVPMAGKVLKKRKKRKEGRNWWGRKKDKEVKIKIHRYTAILGVF